MKTWNCVTIVAAALLLTAGTASAVTETYKLIDSDTFGGENFGMAVDVDGNTAVIGAQHDDDAGIGSGSAYVFDVDATHGTELFKLTATDAAAGDYFGNAVAISGNVAIVGAYGDDDAGSSSGSAYLFDVTTGTQLHKLTASDAAALDNFGYSVAISGNLAIVGAYYDDDAGSMSGSAYVFDVATGTQFVKLTASDATMGAKFGTSVAIDGTIAAVGASMAGESMSLRGKAYLFNAPTGIQLGILEASDIANFAFFGSDVAIDGDLLIVGSEGSRNGGGAYTGSAYVFDVTTQAELAKLTASDQAGYDYFGNCVDIDGDLIVIGAWGNDDGGSSSGSAYFFDRTTYAELDKLTASDAAADDRFGNKVGISGGHTIVGINQFKADVNGAYVFVTESPVLGDFDRDGDVDADDIDVLCDNLSDPAYDLDEDGDADEDDMVYLIEHLVQLTDGLRVGTKRGDFNLDGLVNATDLAIMKGTFGTSGVNYADGNANCDELVNATDLAILKGTFGFTAPPGGVPEPATLALLALGGIATLKRRRNAAA